MAHTSQTGLTRQQEDGGPHEPVTQDTIPSVHPTRPGLINHVLLLSLPGE